MSMINNVGKRILEPGRFEIFIRGSQPDKRSMELTGIPVSKTEFEVFGEVRELEY